MAISPLHPESVTSRPDLGLLDNARTDLDLSRVLSVAAERALDNIREWVRMFPTPNPGLTNARETVLHEIADLETLMIEARCKAQESEKAVAAFIEAEAAHRSA